MPVERLEAGSNTDFSASNRGHTPISDERTVRSHMTLSEIGI